MGGLDPAESSARATDGALSQHSPAAAKIALFRSLFRGREDVYPRRFESRKTGKSGYAPACANEWVQGICEKPRIKCAVCPHRRFLPVTDDVIRWHLSGRDASDQPFVAGVYPMLLDETCYFLAVDFDKAGWEADAVAFVCGCRRHRESIGGRSPSNRASRSDPLEVSRLRANQESRWLAAAPCSRWPHSLGTAARTSERASAHRRRRSRRGIVSWFGKSRS